MKRFLFLFVSAGLAFGTAQAEPQGLDKIVSGCAMCHGKDGDSPSGNVPRLNGQTAAYLAERLRSFRDPTRQSPHATYVMWTESGRVGDARAAALAAYFSRQAATPLPAGGGARAAEGEKIFRSGTAGTGACSACHGMAGQGMGTAPRLAGQHRDYLRAALNDFAVQSRVHDQMRVHSGALTRAQTEALVAYLARD